MSVTATIKLEVKAAETLNNTPSAAATKKIVTHEEYTDTHTLTSATTPPVTQCADWREALTDGAATVDLTAMTGTNGATIVGTGLKVQGLKVKNLGANTLTLTFGASNPYNLLGAAFVIVLAQNQEFAFYGNDATPDIASGAKEIDLSGTGTQTSEWSVIVG